MDGKPEDGGLDIETRRARDEATNARREAFSHTGAEHPQAYEPGSPVRVNKLGHLVYEVSDMEQSVRFWRDVMGFTETDRNHIGMVFFRCNSDHHAIGLKPGNAKRRTEHTVGLNVEHLAMAVDNVDILLRTRDYLKRNGIPIVFEGRKGAGCNIAINFLDPDGYEFELYCRMDQIGDDNRLRPQSQFRPANSLEEAVANPLPETW